MKFYYLIPVLGILLLFLSTTGAVPSVGRTTDVNLSFVDLNDTPNSYVGQAGQSVKVNAGETGLEFYTPSSGGSGTSCDANADCNITGRINTVYDANFALNIKLDGNLYAKDENTYIGNPNAPFNNDIILNALQLVVTMSTRGANMIINGNTYAFCVLNTNPCSGMYFSASDGIRGFRFDISGVPIWYIGTGGGSGVTFQGSRNSNPTTGSGAGLGGSMYVLNSGVSGQSTPIDGNILMINQGTVSTMFYEPVGSRQPKDLNIGMKINYVSGLNRCSGLAILASGTVTVNTACMQDENSMVMLTKQGKIGAGVTPIQVENKIFGTSFDIRDSNTAGDANVFWTISKIWGI